MIVKVSNEEGKEYAECRKATVQFMIGMFGFAMLPLPFGLFALNAPLIVILLSMLPSLCAVIATVITLNIKYVVSNNSSYDGLASVEHGKGNCTRKQAKEN